MTRKPLGPEEKLYLRAVRSDNIFSMGFLLLIKGFRVTGCRFVQVADSYTWSFQACTSSTVPIKKKLITRAIKQASITIIFSARACVSCKFQSIQLIIFDYQCDSVSSMVVKFRNHAAAFQRSLPISIRDGEKIILRYVTFIYISTQCQICLQISIWNQPTIISLD